MLTYHLTLIWGHQSLKLAWKSFIWISIPISQGPINWQTVSSPCPRIQITRELIGSPSCSKTKLDPSRQSTQLTLIAFSCALLSLRTTFSWSFWALSCALWRASSLMTSACCHIASSAAATATSFSAEHWSRVFWWTLKPRSAGKRPMMTPWQGKSVHFTDPLCEEFTMDSPHKRTSNAERWLSFVVSLNKLLNKQSIWRCFETPWRSCEVTSTW